MNYERVPKANQRSQEIGVDLEFLLGFVVLQIAQLKARGDPQHSKEGAIADVLMFIRAPYEVGASEDAVFAILCGNGNHLAFVSRHELRDSLALACEIDFNALGVGDAKMPIIPPGCSGKRATSISRISAGVAPMIEE